MSKEQFEEGILSGQIQKLSVQLSLPPWLLELQGLNLSFLEDKRTSKKISYQDRIEKRFALIKPLLDRNAEIETTDTPNKIFTNYTYSLSLSRKEKLARNVTGNESMPSLNPDRLRLWYCAYRLFGNNLMALLPPFCNIGHWSRQEHPSSKKHLGRPHKYKGALHGHSAIPLAEKIQNSYIRHVEPGRNMSEIFRLSLRKDFGCAVLTDANGQCQYYHPEGKPFPTLIQYDYWVKQKFTAETVQRYKLGNERFRNEYAQSNGSFAAQCANLFERNETDAFYVPERPKQILSSEPGLPLAVARLVCTTSSYVLGVGFSYGAERLEAYNSMLFAASIDKCLLGRLFGIPLTNEDWITGLPPYLISDRGPASGEALLRKLGDETIVLRELSTSWSGQSKATVEASHPRTTESAGQPHYRISELNVFEMAKREIMRAVMDNRSSKITDKLTPDMLKAGVQPTPNGMAKYLASRGRVELVQISTAQAVRTFLKPISFTLKPDGLWFECLKYTSDELKKYLKNTSVKTKQQLELKGYCYPLSLRLLWLELNGKLIELEAMLPIRDDDTQLYLALSDLNALSEKRKELETRHGEHSSAAKAELEEIFYNTTNIEWSASTIRIGTPKRGKSNAHDEHVPTVSRNVSGVKR